MEYKKEIQIWASELAEYINGKLLGEDFLLEQGLEQIRSVGEFGNVHRLPTPKQSWLLIAETSYAGEHGQLSTILVSSNPDLAYIELAKEYFATIKDPVIHPTAIVSAKASIGKNVSIGAGSIIGDDVEIGVWSEIQNHVVLYGPLKIGNKVRVMDGAVIGNASYQFIDTGDGLLQPPPSGAVIVEDGVRIGAHTSIERSFGETTRIMRETKIDDLVNIGGASIIGPRVMIAAGSVIGRGVSIGEACQLGIMASLRPGVTICDKVTIGQSAAVVRDIVEPGVYAGVPAKKMDK